MRGLQLVYNDFSLPLLPSHIFLLLQRGLSTGGISFGNICLLQYRWSRSSVGHRAIFAVAPWSTASSSFFSDLGLPFALFHSFCSLLLFLWCFLPFLKHISPEVPPSCLRGSAIPCGESVGAVWNLLCLTWGSPGLLSHPSNTNTLTCTSNIDRYIHI